MAILVYLTLPEGVPIEMLHAVTAEMDTKANPPEGLVVHAAYFDGERVQGVDVWDSQENFDTFGSTMLGPAVAKVAAQHGMEPGVPEVKIVQLDELVRGR
jgi:hypothetical protein